MAPELQFNSITNEPFLHILYDPSTDKHIILTPYRESDKPAIIAGRNTPVVAKWIPTTLPYTAEMADEWLKLCHEKTQYAFEHLKRLETRDPQPTGLAECPVRALREVKLDENGAEVENLFVGDIGLFRYRYHWVDDESEREKITEENKNLAAGDGEILWEIGDWLVPSHHGRGIMTKAIGIYVEWVMVNMNAQRIRAHIMPGNIGSSRVFEKNGFVPVNRSEDAFNKPGPEGEESSKDQSLVFEWIKNKN